MLVELGVKIDGSYYRNVVVMQNMRQSIRASAGDAYSFLMRVEWNVKPYYRLPCLHLPARQCAKTVRQHTVGPGRQTIELMQRETLTGSE